MLYIRILFQCAVCVGSRVRVDDSEDTRVASSSSTRHSQAHVCHVYMPAPPDDVMILLRKYMSSVDPIHRRVAIIG